MEKQKEHNGILTYEEAIHGLDIYVKLMKGLLPALSINCRKQVEDYNKFIERKIKEYKLPNDKSAPCEKEKPPF